MTELSPEVRKQIEEILGRKLDNTFQEIDRLDLTEVIDSIDRELRLQAPNLHIAAEDILPAVLAAITAY